ncbi:MAG: hypothetical protein WDW36_009847 [Sanguina aurantia]
MLAATRSRSGKALQLTTNVTNAAAAQRCVSLGQVATSAANCDEPTADSSRSSSSSQEASQDKYMDKWRGLLTRRGLIGLPAVNVTTSANDSDSPFADASAISAALSNSPIASSPTSSLLTMTLSDATTLMKLHTYGLLELDLGSSVRAVLRSPDASHSVAASLPQPPLSPRFSDPVLHRDGARMPDYADLVRSF